MRPMTDLDDFAAHLARSTRLSPAEARRLMHEVIALLAADTVESFVVRRHRELKEAEQDHVVRAPVRTRVVVPVQFVPNLIAALQEHMRVFSDSYSNVGWTKADPIH